MLRYTLILILLIQLLSASILSRPVRAQTLCATSYTVLAGDTFGGIAKKCGVTQAALRAENPQVTNPNLIQVGQQLIIPAVEENVDTGDPEIAADLPATAPESRTITDVPCEQLTATAFAPTPEALRYFVGCGDTSTQIAVQALGIGEAIVVDFQEPIQIKEQTIQVLYGELESGARELRLATASEGVSNLNSTTAGDGRRLFRFITLGNISVGDPARFDTLAFLSEAGQWRFYGHVGAETDGNTLPWQAVHAPEGSWLIMYESGHGTGLSSERAQVFSLNGDQLAAAGISYPITGYVSARPTAPTVDVATTTTFYPRDETGFTVELNFRIRYALPPGESIDLTLSRRTVYQWDGEQNQFALVPEFSTVSEEQMMRLFSLGDTDFLRFAEEELSTLSGPVLWSNWLGWMHI
ncbi:MAG: LysM domain-containing protein [Caldilineaceae bacterium]